MTGRSGSGTDGASEVTDAMVERGARALIYCEAIIGINGDSAEEVKAGWRDAAEAVLRAALSESEAETDG